MILAIFLISFFSYELFLLTRTHTQTQEVLRRRHTVKGVGRYGKQADMWSLGVILYVLLTGTPPFDAADAGLPTTIDFPEHVSADARDLVVQLLQQDPRQRVTVVQACEHAWILQEDGDTHVHPLNDPHLVMTADGNTDMTRRFSVPDCIGNHQSLTNDNVDEALQPLGTSSDTTTIATADGVKESGTWNSSLPVDAAAMRFATSALTDNCGAAPDGVPPVRASERSVDVCDVLIRENPSPFTKDRSLHEQASKSSEKPTICVSAINFSFREQSPMRSASYNKHKDNSILDMVSRKPLSPVSLNEATGAPLSSSSSNTPKPSIVSEQARPQNADAHTVEPAIDDQAWALVATATKRGDPANAITPGASNLRLSAPLEQVVRLPFAASRNSDNRSDDDIRSKFTENTDSISSFSTVPAGELDENLELSLKIEGSDKKVTKIAGRSGSSSSKPKKSSNEAFASHATGKKTGTKNCSSATSKKRPGPARLKTNVTKKTKTGAIASPPTSNVCAATRRAGGGKQTTLNNWFKKHN